MKCPKCGQELRTLSVGVFCDNCGPLEFGMDVRAKIEKAEAKVAELEAQKEKIKAETLDRVEADVETIFTLGFDCAEHCSAELCPLIPRIAEVKSAISKIRGEVK